MTPAQLATRSIRFLFVCLLALAAPAWAQLAPAQLQTLKTAIAADPVLAAQPLNSDGAFAIAQAFNLPSNPAVIVWRTDASVDEIMRNGMDWSRVDNLTVGKARVWDWMGRLGVLNCARPNIRAGIDAAWVGTAADLAVRAIVYTHCKRTATRGEALLATGAGTDVSPSTMGFEGQLTYQTIEEARRQP